jgi:hypothetical protein
MAMENLSQDRSRTRYRSKEAAVAAAIDEINTGVERGRHGGGSN